MIRPALLHARAGRLWRLIPLALLISAPAWGQIELDLEDRLGDGTPSRGGEGVDWSQIAAEDCPLFPSYSQCVDPGWITSACAERDRQRAAPQCPRIVRQAQEAAAAAQIQTLVMTADTEADVEGSLEPFPPDGVVKRGAGLAAGQVGPWADALADGARARTERRARHQRWHGNCATLSCEEYVHEAFYDYVMFEEAASALGDDWRGIFELAYSAEGLAGRDLERFNGRRIPGGAAGEIAPQRRSYKNRFLAHQPWRGADQIPWADIIRHGALPDVDEGFLDDHPECRYDPVGNRFACSEGAEADAHTQAQRINDRLTALPDALTADLQGADPDPYPPAGADPWQWHRQSSDALSAYADERLLWLDEQQRAFRDLRADRAATLQALIFWANELRRLFTDELADAAQMRALFTEDYRSRIQALLQRLQQLDQDIVGHLLVAQGQGCLDAEAITPCDWSPRWLAEDLRDQFIRARADATHACQALTANNFSWLHADGEPHWLTAYAEELGGFCHLAEGPCALRQTYVEDSTGVELYFSTVRAWLESLSFDRDPETGRVIVGRTASDDLSLGGGLFSVDFDFDSAWRLSPLRRDDPCAARVTATAGVDVDVTAFGFSVAELFNLVRAPGEADEGGLLHADVISPPDGAARADAVVDISVLGNDLFDDERYDDRRLQGDYTGQAFHFYFAKAPSYEAERTQRKTFSVGVVPMTVEAGIGGAATVAVRHYRRGFICAPDAEPFDGADDLELRIEPSVSATAFASVSAGIPGASLGVRGDVTLIRLGLPLEIEGGYTEANGGTLDATMTAAQTLELLRGSISLVAEFTFITYTKRLFGWRGPRWSTEIFRDRLFGPLLTLINAFGEGEVRPRRPAAFDPGLTCDVPLPVPETGLVYFDFDDEHVAPGRLSPVDLGGDPLGADVEITWAEGVSTGLPGVHGQSLDLDPEGALALRLPERAAVSFTYSLWIKPADQSAGTLLSLGGEAGEALVQLERGADERLYAFTDCGGSQQRRPLAQEFGATPDRWTHAAVVYDRGAERLSFYVDGRLFATRDRCAHNDLGVTYALGRSLTPGLWPAYVGQLDDLGWWNGIHLSPDQVATIAERGADGRPVAGDGAALAAGATAFVAEGFDDRIQLTWANPVTLGQPGGVAELVVRGSPVTYPQSAGAGALIYAGDAEAFTHEGLTPGETWFYTLFSLREGVARRDAVAYATTVSAPPAPLAGFTVEGNVGHARLSWTRPEAPDVARIVIRRHPSHPPGLEEGALVYRGLGDGALDQVDEAGRWHYSAYVLDYAGHPSAPVSAAADIIDAGDVLPTPPPAIVRFEATPGDATAQLTWAPEPDRQLSGYVVRRTLNDWQTARVYQGPDTTFTDVGLRNDQPYQYTVQAIGRLGRLGPARALTVRPTAGDTPPAPRDFQAIPLQGRLLLTWTDPADPTTQVEIRRSTQGPPQGRDQGVQIFSGRGGQHTDEDVTAGRTYHYAAFSVTAANAASAPAHVSAAPSPLDVTGPGPVQGLSALADIDQVRLLWQPPLDEDYAGVRLTVVGDDAPEAPPALIYEGDLTTALHEGVSPGVTYTYTATPYDYAGNEGEPATAQATVEAPPAPVAVAGPPQRTLAGPWIWLDGADSAAPDGARYSWAQIGGEPVPLVGADGAVARFLAPDRPGTLTFELTVRAAGQVDRDQTTVEIQAGQAAAELPPLGRLEVDPFEVTLWSSDHALVAHAPQSQHARIIDPVAAAVVATVATPQAVVGLDGPRLGYLSGGALAGYDLTTLDDPQPVAPVDLEQPGGSEIYMAGGRVIALGARDDTLRILDETPEGWRVRFDLALPYPDRQIAAFTQHRDHVYVAYWAAFDVAAPPALVAVDLNSPDPAWGPALALDFTPWRLLASGDDLLALGYEGQGAPPLWRVELSDPAAPGPAVNLPGDLGHPDRFQGAAVAQDQLFVVGATRRGQVEAIALNAEGATVGQGFPGPGLPAGSFALWPPEAPQALWISAEGYGAAPGLLQRHALDAPLGAWWPQGAAERAPTVIGAGSGWVVAASQAGVGGYRLTDGAVEEIHFAPAPQSADPCCLAVGPFGAALVERDGEGGAQLRRIGLDGEGRPSPGGATALPEDPTAIWALGIQHVLVDYGYAGRQIFHLGGAAPVAVGDPFALGQLAAFDPAAQEMVVLAGESSAYALYDLSDPEAPVTLDEGVLVIDPNPFPDPDFPSPLLTLTASSPQASLSGGVLRIFSDTEIFSFTLGQPVDFPQGAPAPGQAPGRLRSDGDLQRIALLASGALSWSDAEAGLPTRPLGAVTLPSPGAAHADLFAPSPGPYDWAAAGDHVWIAAGAAGLQAIDTTPIRLSDPSGRVEAGDVAYWTARWDPAPGVIPTCAASSGECLWAALDLDAGEGRVEWHLAEPGPAALKIRVGHSTHWRIGEVRVLVEAAQ